MKTKMSEPKNSIIRVDHQPLVVPLNLWLQWHGDGNPEDDGKVCESEVTWSREKIFDHDVEYVHADEIRRHSKFTEGNDFMTPKTVEKTTECGLPIRDLFAFAGVRKIIGDPCGKLMQDEVADRIQKLVNVLQNVLGLVDALEALNGTHKGTANTAMRRARMMIIETVKESMPEWDVVLEQIHKANANVDAPKRKERQ
jgi:hypothetical protein